MKKKILALTLAASLCAAMFSQPALAAGLFNLPLEVETEEETLEEIPGIGGFGSGEDLISILEPIVEEEEQEPEPAIALDDLNISIWTDEFIAMEEDEDGFVYVYTMYDQSIPYVLIGYYDIDFSNVVNSFTKLMQSHYKDLDVDMLYEGLEIGDYKFTKIIYKYQISGYDAVDTRLFCEFNGRIYMFGMKEIEELDMVVGEEYLEKIAASMKILAGGYSDYPYHVDAENKLYFEDLEIEPESETAVEPETEKVPEKETVIEPETTEDNKFVYTFDEEYAPFEGVWIPFEDGFELFLPAEWDLYDITAEQQQAGVLFVAGDSSQTVNTPYISVSYAYDEDMTDLEDIAEYLEENGIVVEEIAYINDIECILYASKDDTLVGDLFLYPSEGFEGYLFTVEATNYKSASTFFDAMLFSLRLSK